MIRRWRAVGFLLVVSLSVLEPTVARASRTTVVLRGVNTFTSRSATWVLVELRRPTVVPRDLSITYEGDGRIRGYVMIKDGMPIDEAPRLESQTLGACPTPGCHSSHEERVVTSGTNFSRRLPAGTYRLYLIADRAPVTVKIELENVSGQTSVQPSHSYPLEVRTLTPRSDLAPGHNVYSAGDFYSTLGTQPQIGFVGLWLSGATETIGAAGDCLYRDPNEERDNAFAPGCPDGETSGPWIFPGGSSDGNVIASTTDWGAPSGLGVWFCSASVVERYGAVGFWMSLG